MTTALMRTCALFLGLIVLTPSGVASGQAPGDGSVLTYHGHADRSGNFVVRDLTWNRARSLRLDERFQARISGHLYAQPLYWRPPGSDRSQLLVATENNNVYALDATTGQEIWQRSLGKPVAVSSLECGNIDPLGITGTPVIDESMNAVYLDAAVAGSAGPRHLVFWLVVDRRIADAGMARRRRAGSRRQSSGIQCCQPKSARCADRRQWHGLRAFRRAFR